jgi:hypothetical protein
VLCVASARWSGLALQQRDWKGGGRRSSSGTEIAYNHPARRIQSARPGTPCGILERVKQRLRACPGATMAQQAVGPLRCWADVTTTVHRPPLGAASSATACGRIV